MTSPSTGAPGSGRTRRLEIMPDLEERLREEAKVARRDPVALASFEALRLNMGTSDVVESHLLQSGVWKAAEGNAAAVGPYILGIDLGSTEAMSAAAAFWPETGRLDGRRLFRVGAWHEGTRAQGRRRGGVQHHGNPRRACVEPWPDLRRANASWVKCGKGGGNLPQ